jgi:predicted RecA/RadA family phage recombinase
MNKEAIFVQEGRRIPYVAGADIVVGQVIPLGSCVGIAADNIANTETGELFLEGVYQMAAVDNVAFAQGDELYWDDTAGKLTKVSAGNTPAGICFETKLQAGAAAKVKLIPNFDAGSNDALKTEIGATATITVGAEAADKINVIVQLKDITGTNVSHKTITQKERTTSDSRPETRDTRKVKVFLTGTMERITRNTRMLHRIPTESHSYFYICHSECSEESYVTG